MNWKLVGSRHVSAPYQILRGTDGKYEVWLRDDKRYFIVVRYIETLGEVKAICESHAKRETANV